MSDIRMGGHTCMGIESSFLEDGWRASCRCGWRGEAQDTMVSAGRDYESHVSWATSLPGVTKDGYDKP